MNRLHRLLVLVAPALIAGAVIATATIGEAQPTPTPRPSPAPHAGPRRHPVVIQGGDVVLPPEARDQIRAEIDRAMAEIDRNEDIPAKTRARLHRALAKARASTSKDLAKLGTSLREMSDELAGVGAELSAELPDMQPEDTTLEMVGRIATAMSDLGSIDAALG